MDRKRKIKKEVYGHTQMGGTEKKYYLPHKDEQRALWLSNFSFKLSLLADKYQIGLDQLNEVSIASAYFTALVHLKKDVMAYSKSLDGYIQAYSKGLDTGQPWPVIPDFPAISLLPKQVPAYDIFERVDIIVQSIKSHQLYSDVDGMILGIQNPYKPSFKGAKK